MHGNIGMSLEDTRPDQFSHMAGGILTIGDVEKTKPGYVPGTDIIIRRKTIKAPKIKYY